MEDFNINFNIFGEHSHLDEWLVADESPAKKIKRQEGQKNSGEVRQEGQENSGEVTGQKPSTQSCGPFYSTVQT